MPELVWPSKTSPKPVPAELELDSIVYPQGASYDLVHPDQVIPAGRLILGDNLGVLSALLPEWEGRLQLIYADPPFFTNRRFPARIGRGEDSRKPQDWQLAEGYPDHWPDLDSYLDMLYPRLALMRRLLAPTGSLYLHLDWHANAYARLLLDELFGSERLLNEIVWVYHGPSPIRSAFNRKHDTILVYTRSPEYVFNADAVRQPYDPSTIKTFGSSPKAGFGKVPDLKRGKVPEDWWYFPVVARLHRERSGYPTQKPQALLERIVLASSNPGDLVADFFCGSGTTCLAAARLGRRFIGSDIAPRAIQTARARLVQLQPEPFTLEQVKPARLHPTQAGASPEATGRFHLDPDHNQVCLSTEYLPDIEYWEIDPAWDGLTFHSAAQAVRPPRLPLVPDRLDLPPRQPGLPICIRAVHANGEIFQQIINTGP